MQFQERAEPLCRRADRHTGTLVIQPARVRAQWARRCGTAAHSVLAHSDSEKKSGKRKEFPPPKLN